MRCGRILIITVTRGHSEGRISPPQYRYRRSADALTLTFHNWVIFSLIHSLPIRQFCEIHTQFCRFSYVHKQTNTGENITPSTCGRETLVMSPLSSWWTVCWQESDVTSAAAVIPWSASLTARRLTVCLWSIGQDCSGARWHAPRSDGRAVRGRPSSSSSSSSS